MIPRNSNNSYRGLTNSRQSEIILGDMYEEYERDWKTSEDSEQIAAYILVHKPVTHRVLKIKNAAIPVCSQLSQVAFRQIQRQKLHNLINIAGLAIRSCCSVYHQLFVSTESHYDKFMRRRRLFLLPMTWKLETSISPVFYLRPLRDDDEGLVQ